MKTPDSGVILLVSAERLPVVEPLSTDVDHPRDHSDDVALEIPRAKRRAGYNGWRRFGLPILCNPKAARMAIKGTIGNRKRAEAPGPDDMTRK